MKFMGLNITRARHESRSLENSTIPLSASPADILAFFGLAGSPGAVTIDDALRVPAVTAAVLFLSRTLASLPLHAYRKGKNGPTRLTDRIASVVHESPNPEMDAETLRRYFWQQVFTGGRGLAWIERKGRSVEAIWPMNPAKTTISRKGTSLVYQLDGVDYTAADVIDVPFMLHENMTKHFGPITLAEKAIRLSIAMNDYGSQFFAGGGVPPLALVGPLPQSPEGLIRQREDVLRAIKDARSSGKPIFGLPSGHELKPVGIDPEKGQMVEARRFQVEEIARAFQLPPVFLQDLSRATFTNAEQQDLHLVKHLIGQWTVIFEGQLNLKLFGHMRNDRYVEHNLDGLMRGDFKTRIEGITRGIQAGLITPNEGRALENRPNHENAAADELFMQGATVPLGRVDPSSEPPNEAKNDAAA